MEAGVFRHIIFIGAGCVVQWCRYCDQFVMVYMCMSLCGSVSGWTVTEPTMLIAIICPRRCRKRWDLYLQGVHSPSTCICI